METLADFACIVATTIETTTTIEIIISIVVENKFQTSPHIAITIEITTTIEIINHSSKYLLTRCIFISKLRYDFIPFTNGLN